MKKLLLTLVVAIASVVAGAQEKEYNDGYFVANLAETTDKDVKCDVYPAEVTEQDVQKLIDNGRYITSVVYTKDGGMILHKKNTDGIKQIYTTCKIYDIEKLCKNELKEGYVLNFYNDLRGYAIFNFNGKAKNMKVLSGSLSQSKITKLNQKGMFAKILSYSTAIAYDGRDDIKSQVLDFAISNDDLLKKFSSSPKSYIVNSVVTSFNKHNNETFYRIIYDIYKDNRECSQHIGRFERNANFANFIKDKITPEYNLTGLWGGWENFDYKEQEARIAAADDTNIFDILSGLMNSVSGLTGHGSYSDGGAADTGGGASGYSSPARKGNTAGKCRRCNGSGKCSPMSGSGRKNACNGSGLCGYCSGTGWNKAGASEARCTACNGKGKCKTCGGTGKCPVCHGSGR